MSIVLRKWWHDERSENGAAPSSADDLIRCFESAFEIMSGRKRKPLHDDERPASAKARRTVLKSDATALRRPKEQNVSDDDAIGPEEPSDVDNPYANDSDDDPYRDDADDGDEDEDGDEGDAAVTK